MNREKKSRNAVSFIQNDEKTLAAVSEQSYLRNRTEDAVLVKVTDSYFYQTNTALYPVKSENSPTTADDR